LAASAQIVQFLENTKKKKIKNFQENTFVKQNKESFGIL
jgi:hypothetical protein